MSLRDEDWSQRKARMRAAGFRPSRRLGQNFLTDDNLLAAIVRDAAPPPGGLVIEVGVGLGVLTEHLLQEERRVVAFEIDPRLYALTSERFEGEERLQLILADVLAGKNQLAPEFLDALPADGDYDLVSNLPYAIAGPLLAMVAELPAAPRRMTVLVQKEQADRLLARPGTPDWGPLSVRLQLAYEGRPARAVPAAAFWPRPEVESRVVILERLPDPAPLERRRAVGDLARSLFLHRRQSLGRVLGRVLGDREAARVALEQAGLDPAGRAEALSLAALETLQRHVENSSR